MSEIYSSSHDQPAAQPMSVGKRSLIHRLARCSGKFLFTRPPGFGKTHLIKNLSRHFSHPTSGSFAEASAYLVTCLDFETCRYITSVETFRTQFRRHLTQVFSPYGFAFELTQRFGFYSQLSRWLQRVPTASLVLLIDNYDAPLRSCLNNPTSFQAVSQELASFFSEVKFRQPPLPEGRGL